MAEKDHSDVVVKDNSKKIIDIDWRGVYVHGEKSMHMLHYTSRKSHEKNPITTKSIGKNNHIKKYLGELKEKVNTIYEKIDFKSYNFKY